MNISQIRYTKVNFTAQAPAVVSHNSSLAGGIQSSSNILNAYITNVSTVKDENNIIDLKSIESYNLPNGTRIDFDTHWSNKETCARILLTPTKEIDTKPGTYELLNYMLEDAPSKLSDKARNNYENELHIGANLYNKHLSGYLHCDHTRTMEGVDKLLGYTFNPSFTQEGFSNAKGKLAEHINFCYGSVDCQVEEELRNGNLEEKRKNIDTITLQDVQNLYAGILNNSEGKVVVSLPKAVYVKQRDNLLTAFSTKMPTLKQYTGQEYIKTIQPVEKSLIYKGKSDDNKIRYNRYFVIQDDNSVKSNVLNALLSRVFENALKSTLTDENYTVRSDSYNLDGSKYMYFSIVADNKMLKPNFDGNFKLAVEKLTQIPTSKDELFLVKHEEKEFTSGLGNDQSKRTGELVSNRPYGNNYINEYAKEIDKITAADIQQAAQRYLTQPSITAVSEDFH